MIKVGYNAVELGGSSVGGGASAFTDLTDKTTADLPTINTPLSDALNTKENAENKKTDVDANKTSNTFFPTVKAVFDWVSGLFVRGAASSTDNAIARFDGTTGKLLKNSSAVINDAGSMVVKGTAGSGQTSFDVMHEGGASSFRVLQQSASSYFICSSAMNIYTSGSNRMAITTLGRVGINTSSPTALLDVNGSFRVRESLIDSTGSAGTNGQVLKNVNGLPVWSNP